MHFCFIIYWYCCPANPLYEYVNWKWILLKYVRLYTSSSYKLYFSAFWIWSNTIPTIEYCLQSISIPTMHFDPNELNSILEILFKSTLRARTVSKKWLIFRDVLQCIGSLFKSIVQSAKKISILLKFQKYVIRTRIHFCCWLYIPKYPTVA